MAMLCGKCGQACRSFYCTDCQVKIDKEIIEDLRKEIDEKDKHIEALKESLKGKIPIKIVELMKGDVIDNIREENKKLKERLEGLKEDSKKGILMRDRAIDMRIGEIKQLRSSIKKKDVEIDKYKNLYENRMHTSEIDINNATKKIKFLQDEIKKLRGY